MTVAIVTCPSCSTLLLSDTAQCPKCHHVLDPQRAPAAPAPAAPAPVAPETSDAEEPCPNCGDMVRKGLVRCYSCGHFMRRDIARVYQRMQASESPVIYSPVDERSRAAREEAASDSEEVATSDDDFELAPEFSMQAAAPSPPRSAPARATTPDPEPDAGAYSLAEPQAPAPEPPPAPAEPKTRRPAAEAAPADAPAAPAAPAAPEGEAHSVATGGDALLNIALQEEQEGTTRKKRPRRRGGPASAGEGSVLVHCVCGARIRVHERHRGYLGHCPKCKTPFVVPPKSVIEQQAAQQAAAAGTAPTGAAPADASAAPAAGKFARWMRDVSVHVVNPQKLRLKPGSLKGDFQAMDLGFSAEGLLLATLVKKGGLSFGSPKKKIEAAREALLAHLREGKAADDAPAASKRVYPADAMKSVAVVQPAPYAHESMFGGVPVFGEGRIAVRLPKIDDGPELWFASFGLADFREFAAAARESYGVADLGREQGVPLEDEYTELACHYTDEKLRALEHVSFYQVEPKLKLKLIGRRCQGCGLVISEDARKKEKIGGANGKGIAKAKCPKCGKPFGDISLYALEEPAPSAAAETPAI